MLLSCKFTFCTLIFQPFCLAAVCITLSAGNGGFSYMLKAAMLFANDRSVRVTCCVLRSTAAPLNLKLLINAITDCLLVRSWKVTLLFFKTILLALTTGDRLSDVLSVLFVSLR